MCIFAYIYTNKYTLIDISLLIKGKLLNDKEFRLNTALALNVSDVMLGIM
jgi:hypothetical protein